MDWNWRTLREVGDAVRKGHLSPVEVVRACATQIERLDGVVRAFAWTDLEGALEEALRAEKEIRRRGWKGLLHGVPVALKDNIDTRGIPTENGSEAFRGRRPERNGTVWERLQAAGAVLMGKVSMHEAAWGVDRPPTRNPWDLSRAPGLSSGGAGAAVAAGMCFVSVGTDTGGSIRIPAACCGVVGVKPTYGRVSRAGVLPHSWWLDHVGPLTRCVEDAAVVLGVIAGADWRDAASSEVRVGNYLSRLERGVAGLRVGVPRDYFFDGLQNGVGEIVDKVLRSMEEGGALLREVSIPHIRYGLAAILTIELASAAAWHEKYVRKPEYREKYGREVRALLDAGQFVLARDLLKAERLRQVLLGEVREVLNEVDVLVTPTLPMVAWPAEAERVELGGREEAVLEASWRNTFPWNLTGLPAVSVPCGLVKGLPVGMQVIGRPFGEATVLGVAKWVEEVGGVRGRLPAGIAELLRDEPWGAGD